MAIALQLQPTLQIHGQMVRLSASDFILIPSLFLTLPFIYKRPRLLSSCCLISLLLFCVALAIAYVHGIQQLGVITKWATVKMIGGLVVLGYFLVGVTVAISGGTHAKKIFVATFSITASVLVFLYLMLVIGPPALSKLANIGHTYAGLTANRNAEGLLLLFALCLVAGFSQALDGKRFPWLSWLVLTLLIIGLVLTISVTAWIAAAVCVSLLVVLRVIELHKVCALLLAALTVVAVLAANVDRFRFQLDVAFHKIAVLTSIVNGSDQPQSANESVEETKQAKKQKLTLNQKQRRKEFLREFARQSSVAPRMETNREAIRLWREAPVLGKGLGYFLEMQRESNMFGAAPIQIHNTLLWLLAEFGLIGFLCFVGFLCCAGYQLLRIVMAPGNAASEETRTFALSMLVFCLGWQIMSLMHELMFQRVVWFGLGLALGCAHRQRLASAA